MTAPLSAYSLFWASKKIADITPEISPSALWSALSSGLKKDLWQCEACALFIDVSSPTPNTTFPAELTIHCQGLQSTFTGKLAPEKTNVDVTWRGNLFNGRDGLVEIFLALSIEESFPSHSKTEQPSIEIKLCLQILQQKGRIALLDSRKMATFWQKVVDSLLAHQVTKIQKVQQQQLQRQRQQPSFFRRYRLRLILLATVLLLLFLLFWA